MTRYLGDDDLPEPVRGLPELPPDGERILWQGAPDWRALARRAFLCRAIGLYFGLLALWRGGLAWAEGGDTAAILLGASWFVALGILSVALLALLAWASARATVYTITNRRAAMRIGVALSVTLNLPYSRIVSADLARRADGTGDIALDLTGGKLPWLMLWPHCRPWHLRQPQPAFRALRDADAVAALLASAMRDAEAERLHRRAEADPSVIPMAAE